jgi:hypothetical protein
VAFSSFLQLCGLQVAGCTDRPNIPDLSSWLGGSNSPSRLVKLDEGLYAALLVNDDGRIDRLCLTKGSDVILAVELYGNGRAISIASGGIPALLVHQTGTGLDVNRYLRMPDGSLKRIVYGQDGMVVEDHESTKPATKAPAKR